MTTNYMQLKQKHFFQQCVCLEKANTDSQSFISQEGVGHQTQKHSFPII